MPDSVLPPSQLAERGPNRFVSDGFVLWQGYERTPGLSKFRREERYSAWLHAHRQLLQMDADYASACRAFYLKLAVCLLLAISLYSNLVSPILTGTLCLALTTLCGYQEQRRRNACISQRLSG
mgnify:CR=1 FL=1